MNQTLINHNATIPSLFITNIVQKPPKISRPPTPYQLFCAEVRVHIKRDNPDITFGETGRLLGSKWAALDENTKQVRHQADYF